MIGPRSEEYNAGYRAGVVAAAAVVRARHKIAVREREAAAKQSSNDTTGWSRTAAVLESVVTQLEGL